MTQQFEFIILNICCYSLVSINVGNRRCVLSDNILVLPYFKACRFLVFSNVVTLQQIKCENVSIVLKGTAIVQLICLRFHSVVPGSNPQHTMYNVSVKFCTKVLLLYPVWPDWTIFEDLDDKFSYKSSRNNLGYFWKI